MSTSSLSGNTSDDSDNIASASSPPPPPLSPRHISETILCSNAGDNSGRDANQIANADGTAEVKDALPSNKEHESDDADDAADAANAADRDSKCQEAERIVNIYFLANYPHCGCS